MLHFRSIHTDTLTGNTQTHAVIISVCKGKGFSQMTIPYLWSFLKSAIIRNKDEILSDKVRFG